MSTKYVRIGECNRCGECCLGFKNPCPHIRFDGFWKASCAIYDQRASTPPIPDGPHIPGCVEFPDNPEAISNITIRNKCGYSFIRAEKILVACPNHVVKEYAIQRWIDNVKSFTWPNYEIFMVDNSPGGELKKRYGDQISIEVYQPSNPLHFNLRITESMAVIQKKFLAGDYDRWFNVESDVLPPKDAIEIMLRYGQDFDWISHAYPLRNNYDENDVQQGIGCSILSRKMMETFSFSTAGDNAPDGWLWQNVRPCRKFSTMEMWGRFVVQHIHGPGGDEWGRRP